MKKKAVRVLLVDDSPTIAAALKSKLEKYSGDEFEIKTAESLGDGIVKAKGYSPEVILLDLHLTDSEGIDTLNSMNQAVAQVPIIVLSAYDSPEILMQAFENGAYDYLIKGSVKGFDITKSLRSALLRKKEEEQLRLMVEQSLQGIAILQNERVVAINPEVLRITGFDAAEFMGMERQKLLSLAHPDDCRRVVEHIENRMSEKPVSEVYSFRLRQKDRSFRWVEVRDKRIIYREQPALLMSFVDVTDSVKERSAQAHLAAIVDSSSDAIISMTLDGVILSWNRSAEKMYGYSHQETVGESINLIIPPDKRDENKWIFEKVKEGEAVEGLRTSRIHKAGKRLIVSLSASPIYGMEGKIVGISATARDITDENGVRNRLELQANVLDMMKDSVFVHDPEGKIVYVNQEACACSGYSREELLGKDIGDLTAPEYVKEISKRKQMLYRHLEGCYQTVHTRKDGTSFPLEVHTRISEIDGESMVISIARDIRKRL